MRNPGNPARIPCDFRANCVWVGKFRILRNFHAVPVRFRGVPGEFAADAAPVVCDFRMNSRNSV